MDMMHCDVIDNHDPVVYWLIVKALHDKIPCGLIIDKYEILLCLCVNFCVSKYLLYVHASTVSLVLGGGYWKAILICSMLTHYKNQYLIFLTKISLKIILHLYMLWLCYEYLVLFTLSITSNENAGSWLVDSVWTIWHMPEINPTPSMLFGS